MDIVVLIFRILLLVIGSLAGIIYILLQFYQKVPAEKFKISAFDYIIFVVIGLMFGFGTNSYIGLVAFIPLLLLKFVCRTAITPNRLRGSGRWMDIDWKKLNPRGFERNVPNHMLQELNKVTSQLPKDTHVVVPRIYAVILIHFILKRMKKEASKVPVHYSAAQQNMGMEQMLALANNILRLEKGRTEKKDLNIGVLKVTRL